VGYEEGGQLTEAVRRRPYCVLLLDEVEKAHPDVFNILLQLLDDGRLTDSKGRTVDFKNTIVIMTSNIGSHLILEARMNLLEGSREVMREQVMRELQSHFRPEFLNRVDDIVFFEALSPSQLHAIVDIQLSRLQGLLTQRNISLELTDEAKDLLASQGYDSVYGARPLRRVIRRMIENPLSTQLLEGRFADGDQVVVTVDPVSNQFVFNAVERRKMAATS
jgi:ATP-dependent Clp protease ATP-binding subunit ClpB